MEGLTENQEAICLGQIGNIEGVPVCEQAGKLGGGLDIRLCDTTGEQCHRVINNGFEFIFPDGEIVINSDGSFPKQESDF